MITNISHLSDNEKMHFHCCKYCGNYFDMRDLAEVILHSNNNCQGMEKPTIDFGSAKRVGDPHEFLNDEDNTKIDVN